jgi:Fe2+ transport system protein FeoA
MTESEFKKLSVIKTGQAVKIARIDAGRVLNARLAAIGLFPNVQIKVINNGHPGPFVIAVKDSKVALGRGMANKIMVRDL